MAGHFSFQTTEQVRDTCLCLQVQRAARALARRFDTALRPFRLTNGQFSLLNALNRVDPARMSAVADLLAIDRTTLTAALKPLERRGLVASVADPADGRSRRLRLTGEGHRLLEDAYPAWKRAHEDVERLLPTGLDQFRDGLRVLSATGDPSGTQTAESRQAGK